MEISELFIVPLTCAEINKTSECSKRDEFQECPDWESVVIMIVNPAVIRTLQAALDFLVDAWGEVGDLASQEKK